MTLRDPVSLSAIRGLLAKIQTPADVLLAAADRLDVEAVETSDRDRSTECRSLAEVLRTRVRDRQASSAGE